MKLWLDDLRCSPMDWQHVKTAREAIQLLERGGIAEISLDHDLGEPESWMGSGYEVAIWMEEQAHLGNWQVIPDKVGVHSANPVGRAKMQQAIDSIERLRRLNAKQLPQTQR